MFVAAHKCTFFARELVWCGKVYSDGVVSHDPAGIQGLRDVRRTQTASELMQFLQGANWLHTSLPCMAEVVEPLRVFLEQLMAGVRVERSGWRAIVSSRRRVDGGACKGMACCAGFGGASGAALSSSSRVRLFDVS